MKKKGKKPKGVKVNSTGREDEREKETERRQRERESPAGDFGIFLNYNVHPIYSHLL